MKKILIFILFTATFVYANDYIHIVENVALVDGYYKIYNMIAALFNNEEYIDMLRLAYLFGGSLIFAGALTQGDGQGSIKK